MSYLVIRGSSQCLGLNTAWGGLATAAWKKGGHFSCSAVGAAVLLYPPARWHAGAGDSITRFLRNHAVTASEMAASAAERTAARVAGRDVVVIQDTSELALGGRRAKANGYGPVGKGGALRGLLLHAVLAVDAATRAVIGLVDAKVSNREGGKVKSRRLKSQRRKSLNAGSTGRRAPAKWWQRQRALPGCPIAKAISMSTSRAVPATHI